MSGEHRSDEQDPQVAATRQVIAVSRVVWDYVVVPRLLDPALARHDLMSRPDCTWLLGLADALFPLVPRACRAVIGATVRGEGEGEGNPTKWPALQRTSRYFALGCAARVGSGRCIEWILGSRKTRNNRKECAVVLEGLCTGGFLDMAKELVDNGDVPWRGGALRWPVHDVDLLDDLREVSDNYNSILYGACAGGNLEVVKWVMSRFVGVGTEPWELVAPFQVALTRGNVEVAEWMASSTCVVDSCKKQMMATPTCQCAPQTFLQVVKLCMRLFFQKGGMREYGAEVLAKFIEYCSHGDDFEEGCQWIKDTFSVHKFWRIHWIGNGKGLKWVINNFSVEPTQEIISHLGKIADVEVLEWLFAKLSIAQVIPRTIIDACGNKKDSVAVVKWLFPKAAKPLRPKELRKCLVSCLSNNNTAIAEWLENTFHVMEAVNSAPKMTDEVFRKIGHKLNGGFGGIQWFLSHTTVCNIRENSVLSLVEEVCGCMTLTLFLLQQFNVRISHKSSVICRLLEDGDISQVKLIMRYGDFSSSDIQEALLECDAVQSGKVLKWLLHQFHLSEDQVKVKNNYLLALLIKMDKTGCAEWFLHKFHVSLNEFIRMGSKHKIRPSTVGLCMWKMILRVFPEMTAAIVKEHFMKWVIASPLHTTVSRKIVGLTQDDISRYMQERAAD
ncbi:hypothetical protein Pelo_16201 [Pelomyxa schiedti]|nr:hypothetical protein Pelo_16201 [Pelomyxa schiedti]